MYTKLVLVLVFYYGESSKKHYQNDSKQTIKYREI